MIEKVLTHEESVETLMDVVNKHDIKYIRLTIVDLNGSPRAMVVPEYTLEEALTIGIGFDGSSVAGFSDIEGSDLIANPDPSTFLIPMWETPGVAIMFCYISNPDGTPFEGDPRWRLKATIDELDEQGYGFNTGPELEFFYVNQESGSIVPYGSGGYFDLPPLDPAEEMKMETMMCLEAAGFQLDKVHHEVATGQHEINFRYGESLKTADNVMLYKLAVKTIAQKYDNLATFMPKPFWGINGSGCHVHQSLLDTETGKNLFNDPDSPNYLSEMAIHYIGGILNHAKGLSMIVAPLVNSYKRLVPHYEAPVYISWGLGNRSTLVRVPQYHLNIGGINRIEYRHPDPSCNPYLSAVAMLKAGMDGVNHKTDPGEAFSGNIYHLSREDVTRKGIEMLPENLGEAVEALASDTVIAGALGNHISRNLIDMKRKEFEDYMAFTGIDWSESLEKITSWEINQYLTSC